MTLNASEEHSARMQAKARAASRFLELRGYKCEQRNGQRITINQRATKPMASIEDTEIFVGKLPRDLFEDEIVPVMERIGEIYKIRLMMDFSLSNRGFCYIQYSNPMAARNAVNKYNQVMFRNDCQPSGIVRSFDNKRLFFRNLPPEITEDRLLEALNKMLDGVIDVELLDPQQIGEEQSAYVTFKSHDAATAARRILLPSEVTVLDRRVTVDWARPQSRSRNNSDYNNNAPTQVRNAHQQQHPRRPSLPFLATQNIPCSSGGAKNNVRPSNSSNGFRRPNLGSAGQTPASPESIVPLTTPFDNNNNPFAINTSDQLSITDVNPIGLINSPQETPPPMTVLGPLSENLMSTSEKVQQLLEICLRLYSK